MHRSGLDDGIRLTFRLFGLSDIIEIDVVRDIEEQYYPDSGEQRDKPQRVLNIMI